MATPPPPHHTTGPYAPHRPTGPYPGYPGYGPGPAMPPHPVATPEQGAYGCRICGALPVADTKVRGHQGMVLLMRFLSRQGPFCRDCGLATVREMTASTLWQGMNNATGFFAMASPTSRAASGPAPSSFARVP